MPADQRPIRFQALRRRPLGRVGRSSGGPERHRSDNRNARRLGFPLQRLLARPVAQRRRCAGRRPSVGAHKVSWHAVTADTHRVQGAYTFMVR